MKVRTPGCGDQPDHLRRSIRPTQDRAGARHRDQAHPQGEFLFPVLRIRDVDRGSEFFDS